MVAKKISEDKMAKKVSKRTAALLAKLEEGKVYDLKSGVEKVKELKSAKFDEMVEPDKEHMHP